MGYQLAEATEEWVSVAVAVLRGLQKLRDGPLTPQPAYEARLRDLSMKGRELMIEYLPDLGAHPLPGTYGQVSRFVHAFCCEVERLAEHGRSAGGDVRVLNGIAAEWRAYDDFACATGVRNSYRNFPGN